MSTVQSLLRTACFAALASLIALAPQAAPAAPDAARQDALLDVANDQMPNDTGSDGGTTMRIEPNAALGGKALKVVFAAGDSVGVRQSRVKNWKPFIAVEFDAFNPTQDKIKLCLSVRHRRTTSFQTRMDAPFVLRPGKNSVKLGIDEMTNVNGSAPDLADVQRWYIALQDDQPRTIYFGNLWLVGDALAAPALAGTTLAAPASAAANPVGYRVTGKIGNAPVDLTVTPIAGAMPAPGTPPSAGPTTTDPARMERIRAAKMPPISRPVLFNTPEADAICGALEAFPPDNPWNQTVDTWPVHPNSKNIIASIGVEKPLRSNYDMGFVVVPPDQKKIDLAVLEYKGESDPGPYPIPDNVPIEGWPGPGAQEHAAGSGLDAAQRDLANQGGDRHASVVDPVNRKLYEFYQMKKTDRGWQAAQASIFDLASNKLRPDGWTSTDAAGLPIFPATVRYDELKRGSVEHALRVTVVKTRRDYVAPATHYASPHTDESLPRMGERLRLRQDYDISGFSPEAQTILKALKKYGMFVADNGIDWAVSVAPDHRIPELHAELRKVKGAAFEVVTRR